MRKIKLEEPQTRKWKRWRKDCEKETQTCIDAVRQGNQPEIKEKLYKRKSIKEEYFFSGKAPFYGKCAYCECNITATQHGDVEHFRPKGGVTDESDWLCQWPEANRPIYLQDDSGNSVLDTEGKPIPRPGYYWLAYDWRNLLPACIKCNQASTTLSGQKVGKHNRFPISGRRAQTPSDNLHDEKPLLINPASDADEDNPQKHLIFDLNTGRIISRTPRGKMCVEVFALNAREGLRDERIKVVNEVKLFWINLHNATEGSPDYNEASAKLKAIYQGKEAYTMAARTILQNLRSRSKDVFESS